MNGLLDRIPPRRARRALWAFSLLSVLVSILTVNVGLAVREYPERRMPEPWNRPRPKKAPGEEDLSAIWRARYGEAKPLAPPRVERATPPALPQEPPAPPPLTARFRLRGLVSGRSGSCILEDLENKAEVIVFVNEDLPEGLGRLSRVEPERAVFDVGGCEEAIALPPPRTVAFGRGGRSDPACPLSSFVAASAWEQGRLGLVVAEPPGGLGVLERGDRLLAYNGRSVSTRAELERLAAPGKVRLTLVRDARTVEVSLRIDG